MFSELRFAVRGLLRNPGLAITAITVLSLGIGAVAFTFSLAYGTLYRGLPFPDGEEIMRLTRTHPARGIRNLGVSVHDFADWREQQSSFDELAALSVGTVNVSGTDRPVRLSGAFMTVNGFEILQVQPMLGRGFQSADGEAGAPRVVVLAHHVWNDQFAGDPDVVGRTIRVNGIPSTIVGVMAEGFRFPNIEDVWIPAGFNALDHPRGQGPSLTVFGRLLPEVPLLQARAEFSGIAQRLAQAYPDTNEGTGVLIEDFTVAGMGVEGPGAMILMQGIVFLVLLVACANVANLLLARAADRTREVAIRSALGASRGRIFFRLLSEAGVLALGGAVLGAALAWIGLEIFAPYAEATNPPFWMAFELNGPVLLFVAATAVLVALLSGVLPGLRASGSDIQETLKDQSRGTSSLRIGRVSRVLVIGEIVMSVGLLVAAGLMTRGMLNLRSLDWGFRTEDVFTARLGLFDTDFQNPEERVRFYQGLLDGIRSQPGVVAAALANSVPGMYNGFSQVEIAGAAYGEDQDRPRVRQASVTPGFFETFGVSLVRGRGFNRADDAGNLPVAVVNESFAGFFFPGEEPVGQQIRRHPSEEGAPWLTVVGVAPDMYMQGIQSIDADPKGFYTPVAQGDVRFVNIVARAQSDPMELTAGIRDQVLRLSPDTPLYYVGTLEYWARQSMWAIDVFGVIFLVFGLVALALATVGLYGVMAFATKRRTHEVGVRMALGARTEDVLRLVLRQGAFQLALGLSLGLAFALLLSRVIASWLFLVEPWDATVFLVIATVLLVTGLTASLIPARGATKVDPVEALRHD